MKEATQPVVAEVGNTVWVHYTGTLDDGTQFDTSVGEEPLAFIIGSGQIISGFEEAVIGMQVGETSTVTIPAEEAYGPKDPDMIITMDIADTSLVDPEVGQTIQLPMGMSQVSTAVITAVTETTVTIDNNHFLAGEALTFDIELLEIQ